MKLIAVILGMCLLLVGCDREQSNVASKRQLTEAFLLEELREPGNLADQGPNSALVQEHYLPSLKSAVQRLDGLVRGEVHTIPLVAFGRQLSGEPFMLVAYWLQADARERRLVVSDAQGLIADEVLVDMDADQFDSFFRTSLVYVAGGGYVAEDEWAPQIIKSSRAVDPKSMSVEIRTADGTRGEAMNVFVLPPLTPAQIVRGALRPGTPLHKVIELAGEPTRVFNVDGFVVFEFVIEGETHQVLTLDGIVASVQQVQPLGDAATDDEEGVQPGR